ncbi:MAG TPA: S9 family peptidase [Ignavibacteriaceae bacterium]|nr:S9 family peptidase [Ignavibacteriaceae bacterium]
MKKPLACFSFLFIVPLLFSQKKAFTIEDLYRIKSVDNPAVSPSGDKAAFMVTEYNLKEGRSNSDIYIINKDGTGLVNISVPDKDETSPFWINADELGFLKEDQLYSYSLKNKETEEITNFSAGTSSPVSSADGNVIAFTSDIYKECGTDNDCNDKLKKLNEEGPIQAYEADALLFRHWTEFRGLKETHLMIFDRVKKNYKDIAHSEWLSSMFKLGGDVKYDISPDGKEICFISSPESNLAATTNADLYTVSIYGGEITDITQSNKAWDGAPSYSPDGKYIAYLKQITPGYEADRYRIALYDRSSGETKMLTENFDYTINHMEWSKDSRYIYFTADFEGYNPIYKIDIASHEIFPVTEKKSISGFELAADNSIFCMEKSVDRPGEIYRIDPESKELKQLTAFNKKILEEVDVRPAEQMWVEGADGIKVHVFIVKPHSFDPSKKYPLILNVHGGPQGQWMDSFRGDWQVYPGAGYIVAFPNPHGSTGYGSKYTESISGDWGGKPFEDLMKVVDELEKLPYIDKDRIGAMGWSYGGYMMNWFQAKTKRFKCLASMMGIFDLESMWGSTEELWFVNWDLKGQPWNSEIFQKWSPSSYVKDFATPVLIITGEKDYRVPYTQSIQYFTTLQTLGIDSRLIVFKNDGHWPSPIKSMPLYYDAHLDWFHKYLGGDPAPYNIKEMLKNSYLKENNF